MSRLDRQSFLGTHSDRRVGGLKVGLVGLGGGGSHVAQQCAHLGIGRYVLVDPDAIEDSNLNRLVGGTAQDVEDGAAKTMIAERVIRGVIPNAEIAVVQKVWQLAGDQLKGCDVIIGGLDSYKEREQLERFARRYLIPYIDMGMDVHELGQGAHLVSGQVILSSPGEPCLRCYGFITDERLQREAEDYGAAGGRPQVVWPNGVLASTAVGLLVQLITPWHSRPATTAYLEYDGNKGTISVNPRVKALAGRPCPHHPLGEVGDPHFNLAELVRVGTTPAAPADASQGQFPVQPRGWWRSLWAAFVR